jgi:hypothetical protein
MAHPVIPLLRIIMSAIGAEPDMRHYLALVDGGATDPERTRAASKSRSAAVSWRTELCAILSVGSTGGAE